MAVKLQNGFKIVFTYLLTYLLTYFLYKFLQNSFELSQRLCCKCSLTFNAQGLVLLEIPDITMLKVLTGNRFSNSDFLHDVKILAVRLTQLFSDFGEFLLRMLSFEHIFTSSIKTDVIFEFSAPVFL